jgi:hypothetical protein
MRLAWSGAAPDIARVPAFGVYQRGNGRMAAQFFQAAGAGWPDAADRDAQPGADLGIGNRRVLDEQGNQLPAEGIQCAERLAQRGVALGLQQLLVGRPGQLIREILNVKHIGNRARSARAAHEPAAFPPGRGSQPGSAAGSRILSSWSTSRNQTLWLTSLASDAPSWCRRQMDQISGAYRSTSASHACLSPFLARATRSVTGPSHIVPASEARFRSANITTFLHSRRYGN